MNDAMTRVSFLRLGSATLGALVLCACASIAGIAMFQDSGSLLGDDPDDGGSLLGDDDDGLLLGGDDDESGSLLLGDDDDLLFGGDDDEEPEAGQVTDVTDVAAALAHEELFSNDRYPSATTCRTCHPDHFREWSVSQHAYAQLSPVFNAFHGTVVKLTNGTNGDFCIRCHTPIGMNIGESVFMSNMDRTPASREGITCIVCHRVNKAYGKISGRLSIVEGDLLDPVYGSLGGEELERVLANPDEYRVVTERGKPGRQIHTEAIKFFQLTESGFCGTCHDVTLVNGFRLEEAFSHYKESPAAARGESCQDCHMGIEQGVATGYAIGPVAIVGDVPTTPRKRTNHYFAGPDYPIIHPGLFPHNSDAQDLATMREWIEFDWKAGWGTDEFEDEAWEKRGTPEEVVYPEAWAAVDDRYTAREILEQNWELLDWAHDQRLEVLRNGYGIGDIETLRADESGLKFRVQVKNLTDGHAVPTGFDAERLTWLYVVVKDADGNVVLESGDLDPNGDVRDLHSLYVHNGDLPLDRQLFSLQGKFIIRNLRGGEREQILAVNYGPSPLPFLRKAPRSTVLTGAPGGTRKHRYGIEPDGHRWADYSVGSGDLTGNGPYTAVIELKAAMIPVNLLSEIMHVGLDYNMTPREIADGVREGHEILWTREVTFDPHQDVIAVNIEPSISID